MFVSTCERLNSTRAGARTRLALPSPSLVRRGGGRVRDGPALFLLVSPAIALTVALLLSLKLRLETRARRAAGAALFALATTARVLVALTTFMVRVWACVGVWTGSPVQFVLCQRPWEALTSVASPATPLPFFFPCRSPMAKRWGNTRFLLSPKYRVQGARPSHSSDRSPRE